MTARIREAVADTFEEIAGDLTNEAAHTEFDYEEGRKEISEADLNEALEKRVKAAYYMRASLLLRNDKKRIEL